MRISRRIRQVGAAAAIAASGAGILTAPAPANAASSVVAFVSATHPNHDMAELGRGLNVRIGDATNGFDTVERWQKIPVGGHPGYYYLEDLYDFSYLTAPGNYDRGGVFTAAFQGSTLQMWKINGPSSGATITNLIVGDSRRITYHSPSSQNPSPAFTMDLIGASDQIFDVRSI